MHYTLPLQTNVSCKHHKSSLLLCSFAVYFREKTLSTLIFLYNFYCSDLEPPAAGLFWILWPQFEQTSQGTTRQSLIPVSNIYANWFLKSLPMYFYDLNPGHPGLRTRTRMPPKEQKSISNNCIIPCHCKKMSIISITGTCYYSDHLLCIYEKKNTFNSDLKGFLHVFMPPTSG